MKTNSSNKILKHFLASVLLVTWAFVFTYPSYWHLTVGENWFLIKRLENLGDGMELFFYPFGDLSHRFLYPIHNGAIKNKSYIFADHDYQAQELNSLDNNGKPPLFYSASYCNATFTELLLKNGAELDSPAFRALRFSPMHPAVRWSDKALQQVLMKYGARTNIPDLEGNTPLHKAIITHQTQIVEYAIRHEENLEVKNSSGQTPLELAAQKLNLKAVIALSIGGADYSKDIESEDINIQLFLARCKASNNPEKTALELAEKKYSSWKLPAEFPVD